MRLQPMIMSTLVMLDAAGADTALAANVVQIKITNLAFAPAEVTVHEGDTVDWVNDDFVDHTATAKHGAWNVTVAAGKSGKMQMTRKGTFEYFCRFHPNTNSYGRGKAPMHDPVVGCNRRRSRRCPLPGTPFRSHMMGTGSDGRGAWPQRREQPMTLAEVLAAKGRGVVTLWNTRRLEDAIRLFDDHHIAAVVIVDPERRPLGIIPEREAVHAIARHGASALSLGVTHVMISPPPMCTPDVRVSDALRRMTNDRIRHLIVMNEEEMLGVVSIGDLVKVRLEDADIEGRVLRDMALTHLAND